MINVTTQELESILDTLEKAIAMHDSWREQLQRTVACKLPPSEADMAEDAHQQCAFGKWFYSSGNAPLRKLASFQRVEQLHVTMHGRARELCTMIKGHWAVTPKEYDVCMDTIKSFRGELNGLRQKVFETLHHIDALTGTLSGAHLLADLTRAQEARKVSGQAYSLLLLRFDLAAVNHTLGRAAGDDLLRRTFEESRQILESNDRIYRYAGAEFVICLPGKDTTEASAIKERLLSVIDGALRAVAKDAAATLELQYGIVDMEPDILIEQLINQTERATYTINL